jgi:hypothetical protein
MTDRPSAFTRSIEQVAHDIEAVAQTWAQESRLVRDEAMGAELLLTRELIEQFGIVFETADQLNDLFVRQAGYALRDYADTLRHAASEPGLHNCRDVAMGHLQRRIGHLVEGSDEFAALMRSGTGKLGDALFGLWRPFAAVLGRDWRGARTPSAKP